MLCFPTFEKQYFTIFFHAPIFFVLHPVIFFSSSYIYCLKSSVLRIRNSDFFQELMDLSKKEKKRKGENRKQKTEKTRQCNLKKNFKKRKKKKIKKMCTPKQQKQTNE